LLSPELKFGIKARNPLKRVGSVIQREQGKALTAKAVAITTFRPYMQLYCHRFKTAIAQATRRFNLIRPLENRNSQAGRMPTPQELWQKFIGCKFVLGLAIASLLYIALLLPVSAPAQSTKIEKFSYNPQDSSVQTIPNPNNLPPLRAHPLPSTLAQWQDSNNSGDYFANVQPTAVGYLIWSQFPIKVYLESGLDASPEALNWASAVLQAVREWSAYLPLKMVQEAQTADIVVMRSRLPLRASFNRNTGQFQIERPRTAQARYELYIRPSGTLSHRFTINLNPHAASNSILAAARHELGHALGIWGHSPLQTDALYFSQVRNPPLISARDINTLKRIYEQKTLLGWPPNEKFEPVASRSILGLSARHLHD
jgi:predicted Zn-dependent protease